LDTYPELLLRTLQRRVKIWKAELAKPLERVAAIPIQDSQ